MSRKSIILVIIQFFCLFSLVMTGPFFSANRLIMLLEILSIGLVIWAYLSMGPGNFSFFPQTRQGGKLVKSGPYILIRHPMYSAVLILSILWIIDAFGWYRLVIGIVLFADLLLKIASEENHLRDVYPGYSAYCKRTDRLFPLLY